MAEVSKVTAKSYFETGDVPTQTQFENVFDSLMFHHGKIRGFWAPHPGSNNYTFLLFTQNQYGTLTARTISNTSVYTSLPRVGLVSTTGNNTSAGYRCSSVFFYRGDAAGKGGFRWRAIVGNSTATPHSDERFFVAAHASSGAPSAAVNPSSLTNFFGMGKDANDTNFYLIHNDASGTGTRVDMGANFPSNTSETDVYDVTIWCESNASGLSIRVVRLNTGDVYENTVTTDIPANNVMLNTHIMHTHGTGTTNASAVDIFYQEIEINVPTF
jgi:hypothetical protein